MIMERFELAEERLKEIPGESLVSETCRPYFNEVANYILMMMNVCHLIQDGSYEKFSLSQKKELNEKMYAVLKAENYRDSILNPETAAKRYGHDMGLFLSALYAELQSLPAYAFEQDYENFVIRVELFLELYGIFTEKYAEEKTLPDMKALTDCYTSFVSDYQDELMLDVVKKHFTAEDTFAVSLICESNLSTPEYLYSFGEYITDNEIKMSRFLAGLDEKLIEKIADTYTEGYRKGFIATGKDIHKKKTVAIRYFLGFERVVKKAIENFRAMGLTPVIYRAQPSFIMGRSMNKTGFYGASPNKQFDCDHEFDKVIYYSAAYTSRKLECYRTALETYKKEAGLFGGPAVIEDFGGAPFTPEDKKECCRFGPQEQKWFVEYQARAGALVNEYIKGEERSFTIIAFPVPEIGKQFEEIFLKTVEINTLNYEQYRDIQQKLIDVLDTADYVEIKGSGDNRTDLRVKIRDLQDPSKETAFENCVADVNIPVGEVFTSPVLKGTEGLLHVTEVFLEGRKYENLELRFKDGIVTDYGCSNYPDAEKGREYIRNHVLFQHDTLPMGEFAIGTNTVAYQVARTYHIEKLFPILIAEKTGPHFAVGDTCYSHEEDMVTYNPDGKAIVARENDFSALRNEDISKAYFNCHTDITIPYSELGLLQTVGKNKEKTVIIENGKFVLKGCEELNRALEECE